MCYGNATSLVDIKIIIQSPVCSHTHPKKAVEHGQPVSQAGASPQYVVAMLQLVRLADRVLRLFCLADE